MPGATKYVVYRGEGVNPCDMGKVIVGETNQLSFLDTGLQNGRDYSYAVAAVGASDSCIGPLSTCQAEAPVEGANLSILEGFGLTGGDNDPFLDNCEVATITFPINNSGAVDLTNVRIIAITPVTHPLTTILTPLPGAGRGGPRDLHGRRRRLPDPGAGPRVRRLDRDPRRRSRPTSSSRTRARR